MKRKLRFTQLTILSQNQQILPVKKKMENWSGKNPNCISYECPDETKFTSFGWSIDSDTEVVVLGTESGKISLFLPASNLSFPIGEHIGSRVRCIRCIKDGKFISCSSDGVIKIWSILQNTATLLAEKNCSMRILSLGVYE